MWPLDVVFEYLNHRTINAANTTNTIKDPPKRKPITRIEAMPDASSTTLVLEATSTQVEEGTDYDGLYMPFLTEGETPLVDQDKLVEEINLLLSQYTQDAIEPTLDPCHLPLERHTVLTTPHPSGKNTPKNKTPTHSETNSEHNVDVLDVTNVSDDKDELRRRPTIRLVTPAAPKGPRPLRKVPRKPIPSFEPASRPSSGFALFVRNRPLPAPPAAPRAIPQGAPSTKKRTMKRIYVGKRDAYPSIDALVVEQP